MKKKYSDLQQINNEFYDELAEGWYSEAMHPVAFLRAEHALRIPWVMGNLPPVRKILDVGCGAGLLSNALAKAGHRVTGIDLSEKSLEIAQKHDETHSVRYVAGNAYSLPFQDSEFDVVCVLDVLEHVEEPHLLIGEASRVLKSKGLFFFHTFNRTWLSYFLIIKGVNWLRSTPPNLHIYPLFIKPEELENMLEMNKLNIQSIVGLRPIYSKAFWKMIWARSVPPDFSFCFCSSLRMGYCGYARKRGSLSIH
jgi:2-polyprenyl-6-hydroxyphenyl methylase / 3-demethylubiquinone-9 3-methyltransferase